MGLDSVEIVLRTEELFAIILEDREAATIRTVGDFYCLLCAKLSVPPLPNPVTSPELPHIKDKRKAFLFGHHQAPLPTPPECLPWSPQTIWDALVAIFVDLQGLRPADILPDARIAEDLGVE